MSVPLDWWNLPWAEVRDRLIRSMCPEKVCRTCGAPRRRIVEPDALYAEVKSKKAAKPGGDGHNDSVGWTGLSPRSALSDGTPFTGARFQTVGFTDCGHNDWRPGLVVEITGET